MALPVALVMVASSQTPPPVLRIAEHFADLRDPRVVGRTNHSLITVLVIGLVGVICGANGWEELEEIGKDREAWFARFLAMPHGVPSADTFRRVFSALRPSMFADCMRSWVESLAAPLHGQVVAFDGKTIRGALQRTPMGTALHQVHVWSCQQRLLLAQAGVAGAPEEIDTVRQLLTLVELQGAIATGDAAHCSAATAQSIVDAGGNYLLHLKGNRANLHKAVASAFLSARASEPAFRLRHARTEEHGHGRTEIREAWAMDANATPLPTAAWPSLRSVLLIERTRIVDGIPTLESHYYLSSLPARVRRMMDAAREHWRVENDLHWVLDVQMGEDVCTIHDEYGAQNFGALRRLSLMLLQRETDLKRGLAAKRAKAARNTSYLERVLTRGISEHLMR